MRKPEYLSPTSLALFRKDPEQYYIKYLCEQRLPRDRQTDPMAVGSSFDAYAKSFLYMSLVGKGDPKYSFEALFEAQVEPHARDRARAAGKYVFDEYKATGALADLLLEMKGALGEPRFEISVESKIVHNGKEVPFLGKPDIFFINKEGGHIIVDFKVNGFYSRSAVSPMKGYMRLFPGNIMHGDCISKVYKGFKINMMYTLEMLNNDWAAQTSIYAWLCGCDVGDDWAAGIDQVVCKPNGQGRYPILRFAQHRCFVDPSYQKELFLQAAETWEIIQSGYIFRTLSREESDSRCRLLDSQVDGIAKQIESGQLDELQILARMK